MTPILLGSTVFSALIMTLVLIVLAARTLLTPRGAVRITVNAARRFEAALGLKLLQALEAGGVHVPSSCGGAGTCGQCRVVLAGAGPAGPAERSRLDAEALARGERLACQVVVRRDLELSVPPQWLAAQTWHCRVERARTVAPLIKEIVLRLPEGSSQQFDAGVYVQVSAPAYGLAFSTIEIEPRHEAAWTRMNLRALQARSSARVSRAYSLANRPSDTDVLVLNVRLALPPASQPDAPPGLVSSWLFGLKPGDPVLASGPYGDFFITDSAREIVLIGGGVGMAPLRAHAFDQLERRRTSRIISFWYGARALGDLYYADEMEKLAREHPNFSWHVALSEPAPGEDWRGEVGFIHELVQRRYLATHADPGGCEYYLCGPPLMLEAALAMLERLHVPRQNVRCDDFGG